MKDKAANIKLGAALTVAWLGNAHTRTNADDVPAFLRMIVKTLEGLGVTVEAAAAGGQSDQPEQQHQPAVSVRKSLASPDFIISLLDGKPYKALKRHLTANGLTPDAYRARYGLKPDYPMTAPSYAAARSETAKRIGLGRKPGQKVVEKAKAPEDTPAAGNTVKKGRASKSIAEAKAAAKAHLES